LSTTTPVTDSTASRPGLVAPSWHTVLLIAILLVLSFGGTDSQHGFAQKTGRLAFYLITMAVELLMVGYVAWGIHQTSTSLGDLIGGRWNSKEDFLLDVVIAVGFWVVSALVLAGLAWMLGLTHPQQLADAKKRVDFLMPHSPQETLVWVLLSACAGFCEEIIFRGYLQKQFGAWLKSAWAGVVLQGAFFGASHAYEGRERMLIIAVYGMMFGVLALLRRSLRPGMFAHAMQDSIAGLAFRLIR